MKRFKRIYVEITNICNLKCSFCIQKSRPKASLSVEQFAYIVDKITPYTDYIYLHVLGEPLLHADLMSIVAIAKSRGLYVNITTNGALISRVLDGLEKDPVRKIAFSIHSFAGNNSGMDIDNYLGDILSAIDRLKANTICELRFWDKGSGDYSDINKKTFAIIEKHFAMRNKIADSMDGKGLKIEKNVYIGSEAQFEWPTLRANDNVSCVKFCYGMRDQLAILVDGTVVPCCLDSGGSINLGNIFTDNLGDIITSPRALAIYDGFGNNQAVEELCKHCHFGAVKF